MSWKDLSELHLASLATEDDTLFDRVIQGKIAEACWRIDQRNHAASSASSPGDSANDAARIEDLMRAFGVERFSEMGEPIPVPHLVRNVVAVAHPTIVYGGRGSLKSLATVLLSVAVSSPEVDSVFGYPVEKHGPVVIYDSELNAQIFNDRTAKICKGLGIPRPKDLYYKNALGVHPKQGFDDLHSFAEGVGAVMCVVDSLGFATRGNPEDYEDTRDITTDYMNPLIAKGICVVMVDHMPHNAKHVFGSVGKEYYGRFIFRTEDLDGGSRSKGERNIQLVNEKASFAEEGQKITLLTKFSEDSITMTPQGTPDEVPEDDHESAANPKVRVRRALMAKPKQTTSELAASTGVSYNYLRNTVLPEMKKHQGVFKLGTQGRNGEAVWDLNPPDESFADAASSASSPRDSADDAASKAVVEDAESLGKIVDAVRAANTVALDLETMPPAGWKDEVLAEYLSQLAKLKKRPKVDSRKNRLTKIKEKAYKKYATDTDLAVSRVISVATEEINILVDVTKVNPASLLEET